MKKIDKPWGHEIIWAETKDYIGKIIHINPGHRLSLQYHEVKEETIYVMSGHLALWESDDNDNYIVMGPGTAYHITPGQIHRFGSLEENGSNTPTILMEVSTPYLQDVKRLADDYRR
jgi:mannose-6-phosphate isomerase-like protein (cupin superfamily)